VDVAGTRAQQVPSAPLPVYTPWRSGPAYSPYAYSTSTATVGALGITSANDSDGNSYTTTSQQFGNLRMSNTTGTNGYWANSTTQKSGSLDYMQGYSSAGTYSGTRQRIGNIDYSNVTAPTATWNGTSQQSGNITFHNYTGSNGQTMTGTSMKIGDFISTNVQQ
jgi:hypothetical protein